MSETTTADQGAPPPDAGNNLHEPDQGAPPVEQVEGAETEPKESKEPDADTLKEREIRKLDRRIARWTADAAAKDRALAAKDAEIERLRRATPTQADGTPQPEDREAEVQRKAEALVARDREIERATAFNKECDKIAVEGHKEYGETQFREGMVDLWQACGGFDPAMAEAAMETGNPHQVLYKLSQDLDEAERIGKLPAGRKGAALAKFARGLEVSIDPPAQSKAPAPIAPLRRGGGNAEPRLDAQSQDEFERAYQLQLKKRTRN